MKRIGRSLLCAAALSWAVDASAEPCVVKAGETWLPLEYRRDIVAGSALDFSHMGFADAPAGKHGYIDDHFYVDHPSFPVKPWSLPSTCPNKNPLLGKASIAPSKQAFSRMFGKPFTITEWNFSGPGRYRGVGGILAGAMAALQDWDGMWRFAYSHTRDSLRDSDVRSPGYFDLASDPLSQAGAFRAKVEGSPATVWVSSLDGKAIAQSRRMLITHLTDVQGEGATFGDKSMTLTLKWGWRPLVRNGKAHVELHLDEPKRHKVYEIATNGRRVAAVPSWVKDGWLRFTATVAGAEGGARMLYEVVAE